MAGPVARGAVRVAGAGVVLFAAAACGAAAPRVSAPPAPPREPVAERAVAVPAGYRVHRLTEAGLALALPAGWRVVAGPDARYPGVIQTLSQMHPPFRPYLLALAVPESSLKLFAFDSWTLGKHPSTATVENVGGSARGGYARWSVRALASLGRMSSLRGKLASREVQLAYGPALRVEFDRSDGDRVVVFVLARHGSLWALTFAAPPAAPGRAAFDRSARTLTIGTGVGGPRVSSDPNAPSS